MSSSEIKAHPNRIRRCFFVDTMEEANEWISVLLRCTLPFEFLSTMNLIANDA